MCKPGQFDEGVPHGPWPTDGQTCEVQRDGESRTIAPGRDPELIAEEGTLALIGYLAPGSPPSPPDAGASPYATAFHQELRGGGLTDSDVTYKHANGNISLFPTLVGELMADRALQLVVASSSAAVAPARANSRGLPVVVVGVGDPSLVGGGSGRHSDALTLCWLRLGLLLRAFPTIGKVHVIWEQGNPSKEAERNALLGGAPAAFAEMLRSVVREGIPVTSAADLSNAFTTTIGTAPNLRQPDRGALILESPLTVLQRNSAIASARGRCPVMWEGVDSVRAGGLMSYGPDRADNYRAAAAQVLLTLGRRSIAPGQAPGPATLSVNTAEASPFGLACTVPIGPVPGIGNVNPVCI